MAEPAATPAPPAAAPAQVQPMLDRQGQIVPVPVESAQAYQAQGFLPLSPEDVTSVEQHQRYGAGLGNALTAGVLGAGRMLTLGGSDLAAVESGAFSPEELQGLAEQQRTATTVGKGLGLLAPLLASGGAAAPEEAALLGGGEAAAEGGLLGAARAGVAASPLGAVGELGGAAQSAVQGALGEGLLGRALGGAARGAVEAPLYQAGENLSEDVLHNKDLTAESLLAGTGQAALLGGALGGSIEGALGLGERYLPRALERAQASLDALAEKVKPASFEPPPAPDVIPGVEVPAGPRDVPGLPAREAPVAPAPKLVPDTADAERSFRDSLRKAYEESEAHDREFFREHYPAKVKEMLGGSDPSLAGVAGDRLVAQAREALDSAAHASEPLRLAREIVDRTEASIDGAKDASDIFLAINKGKQQIDRLGKYDRVLTPEQLQAMQPLREAVNGWRAALEDASVWGKEAAGFQRETNAAFSRAFDARKGLEKAFMRRGATDTEGRLAVDARKVSTYVKDRANGLPRSDDANAFLGNWVQARRDLLDHLQKAVYEKEPKLNAKATGLQSFLDDLTGKEQSAAESILGARAAEAENAVQASAHKQAVRAHAKQLREDLAERRQAVADAQKEYERSVRAAEKTSGQMRSAQLAEHRAKVSEAKLAFREAQKEHHGLLGIVAEHLPVVGPIYRHTRDAEVLHKLVKRTADAAGRVAAAIRSGVTEASPAVVGVESGLRKDGESLKDAFLRHAEALGKVKQDPAAAAEALSSAMPQLGRFAPTVAAKLHQGALGAASYLAAQLPKDPRPQTLVSRSPWVPSEVEMRRFESKVRVVNSPRAAAEDFKARRLTHDAVDALEKVYPQHLASMRAEAHAALADLQEEGKPLPVGVASQLQVLLGQPVTYAQTPGAQQVLSAADSPPATAAAGSPGPGPAGFPAASALKLAQAASTTHSLGGSR